MGWIKRFRREHASIFQFIIFTLLSCAAGAVDLLVFNVLNGWLLVPLKDVSFSWWLMDYNAGAGGGLCALISTAAAYFAAQTVNFFVQRRGTFRADNSVAASGAMYLAMIIGIWFLQIFCGALFMNWFAPWAGNLWAGNLSRLANNTLSLIIQFPLNKYVIMKSA